MRSASLFLLFLCWRGSAQIVLRINDAPPVTISSTDFAKLPRHTAVLNDHGKQATYEGPLLHDLLEKGGLAFGRELRGKALSTYVAASAADGYQVVYALAEFDPTVVDSGVIVADKRDGQALAATEGPLRIIAPHDKRPTRCLKMLQEIDTVQLKH